MRRWRMVAVLSLRQRLLAQMHWVLRRVQAGGRADCAIQVHVTHASI